MIAMKNVLLVLLFLSFYVVSCVDDKTNLDYKDINGYDGYKISEIVGQYTLFPGESLTLTPKVRLSRDTINPDLSYSWLLDGEEVCTEASYTFVAGEEYGEKELIFNAIDNKTGVAFPAQTTLNVLPLYKLGWLFLVETASGESRLDLLVAKTQAVYYTTEWGLETSRDSLVYVQFETGVGEELGRGPIKLLEEYPSIYYAGGSLDEESEIMVLQESGPIELGGNDLLFAGDPLNEFVGDVPVGLVVKDAALSFWSKWLLDASGCLYGSTALVVTDLHSGRYNSDPAFNGMKFDRIIQTIKTDDNQADFVLAIDEGGTMWAIVDNALAENESGIVKPLTSEVGKKLAIENNTEGTLDMSLFKNFKGERIKDCLVKTNEYFLSLLKKEDGTYIWHKYLLTNDSYDSGADYVRLEESTSNGFASAAPFADFRDAAMSYDYYDYDTEHKNWLMIASGAHLFGCNMTWSTTVPQAVDDFFVADAPIKMIEVRNVMDADYVTVGVLMEDGTFEILEVKFDMKQRSFVYKSVYKENLRVLDPEIKEIVDFIPKYGNGSNLDYGLCR